MTKPEGRIRFHLTKFIDKKNRRFTESQMVGQKCNEIYIIPSKQINVAKTLK